MLSNNKKHMELKVMYCKDIKAFNFFQKLALYVVVSLVSEDLDKTKMIKQGQTHRTPVDKEGGENPEWNKEETMMQFDLEEAASLGLDHIFLKFDVRHQGAYFGDKTIAEVRVPLEDLIDKTSTTDGILRFVSYQARGVDGGPNGLVHFSYKLLNYHGKPELEEHRHHHHDQPVPPVSEDQQAAKIHSGGLYPVVESSIVPRSVELYADPMADIRRPPPPPQCYYPPPFGMFVHHRPPPPPPQPIWLQGLPHNPHSLVFHPPQPSGAYGGNWGARYQ